MEAIEEISKAKTLLKDGLITDEEFRILKAEIISKLGASLKQEDTGSSNLNIKHKKKHTVKETGVKSSGLLTEEKSASIKNSSAKTPPKDQSKPKLVEEKPELVNKSKGRAKKEVTDDVKLKKKEKTNNNEGSYKVKKSLFIVGLIIFAIVSFTIDPDDGWLIGFFGGLIAMVWWLSGIGRRSLFFFYAPYILFAISFILFSYGIYNSGEKNPDDRESLTIFFWFFSIVELLAFLFEYFLAQPKCPNCGKRSGMKKFSESDFSSYDYIGTKTYSIRSKGGEKIGEYEGPVSRTAFDFTAHYQCHYCNNIASREESRHYDN